VDERKSMSVKNKLLVVPTTIALVIFAMVALPIFGGQPNPGGQATRVTPSPNDDYYSLSVTWTPAAMPQHSPVEIEVKVDGWGIFRKKQRVSPWGYTMIAERGAKITLTALSRYTNTIGLDCIIMRNSRVDRGGHDGRTSPGEVRCEG
jgi:hypothetical protein